MNASAPQPNRRRTHRGQGMTEYILIVCLMAIASIGMVTLFGDNVRRLFAMSADSLAGADSVAQANTIGAVDMKKLHSRTLKEFAFNNTPY